MIELSIYKQQYVYGPCLLSYKSRFIGVLFGWIKGFLIDYNYFLKKGETGNKNKKNQKRGFGFLIWRHFRIFSNIFEYLRTFEDILGTFARIFILLKNSILNVIEHLWLFLNKKRQRAQFRNRQITAEKSRNLTIFGEIEEQKKFTKLYFKAVLPIQY